MIKPPMVDSVWSSTDSVEFKVKEIFEQDSDAWIRYVKMSDNTEYTCLVDAFLQRFREQPK